MMALRIASLVAAMVTITLNASYGFKTSTVLEYAILFAALNAALDVAKCSCLIGAARAWHAGNPVAGIILFLMFWPLLANSLWCGLSEVTHTRAAEQSHFDSDTQARAIAAEDRARATAQLTDIEANPAFKSSIACAYPKTQRERALCSAHQEATGRERNAAAALIQRPAADPSPQLTLLARWTGYDLATILLAAALWPIALAELTGSVGFYLTTTSNRTGRRWNRFRSQWRREQEPVATNTSSVPPETPGTIRWPALAR